jgi:hypothetical protein
MKISMQCEYLFHNHWLHFNLKLWSEEVGGNKKAFSPRNHFSIFHHIALRRQWQRRRGGTYDGRENVSLFHPPLKSFIFHVIMIKNTQSENFHHSFNY